jgi:hypothetical protein
MLDTVIPTVARELLDNGTLAARITQIAEQIRLSHALLGAHLGTPAQRARRAELLAVVGHRRIYLDA